MGAKTVGESTRLRVVILTTALRCTPASATPMQILTMSATRVALADPRGDVMSGEWELEDLAHGQNIRPLDDIIIHAHDENCPCYPKVVELGWSCRGHEFPHKLAVRRQVQHKAMDGRVEE